MIWARTSRSATTSWLRRVDRDSGGSGTICVATDVPRSFLGILKSSLKLYAKFLDQRVNEGSVQMWMVGRNKRLFQSANLRFWLAMKEGDDQVMFVCVGRRPKLTRRAGP